MTVDERAVERGATASTLLAIDSSTAQAGVALFDGERIAELSWAAGRSQTASLLAQIHHLLELHDLETGAIAAIAVATGPGTFNGLRVGISVAKGLVLGLGVPLIGVPTLAAAALPHAESGRPVIPVVAAGRGRLVWAEYRDDGDGWAPATDPRNSTVEELARYLASTDGGLVTGELTPEQEAIIAAIPGVRLPPRSLRGRRPAAVAALAWARFLAGTADDPAALAPIYLSR